MEHISTSVLGVCLTAAALTLTEGVLPVGKFERQIRLLFAAVLLTVLLRPLAEIRLSGFEQKPDASQTAAADLTELAKQAQEQAICESIRNSLNQQLAEKDIPCTVTGVSAYISEDGSIGISEVRISGNLLTGRVCLKEWLGREIRITEGGC